MTDGWFAAVDPAEPESHVRAILDGSADEPRDWPTLAVEAGFAADEAAYYEVLHRATLAAARAGVTERERADDQQLVHAVRAMDDVERIANELAERVVEWAGTLFDDVDAGVDGAITIADREPTDPVERQVVDLASQVADLVEERGRLQTFVERGMADVAPNLTALAGPILGARLLSLAGGLEQLAKKPSGTVQVLGAEDALFAHLSGRGPSPKHGIIFTHEYVRGTRPEDRGSAARAVAGKLAIAARIDHYAGDHRPELGIELDERIRRIRDREAPE